MRRVLGRRHPYTLCVCAGLATDLALRHELPMATDLSQRVLAAFSDVWGEDHPYTLASAVNAAFDLIATGDRRAGQKLFERAIGVLGDVLGEAHPEVIDMRHGRRAELDIEPPPT
jgi:hypothetical protein